MNRELKSVVNTAGNTVLNYGSGDDRDCEESHYRYYFSGVKYKSFDPNYKGAEIKNSYELQDKSFDTILNFWVLEHIYDFHNAIQEMARICNKNLFIALPFKYPYHPAPNDYWRFTKESAVKILEDYFEIKIYKEFDNGKDQAGCFVAAEIK